MWFVNKKSSNSEDFLSGALCAKVYLWPEAEDRALRGRNLSAVFRTLYRQVREAFEEASLLCTTWRVENQCDKSTVRTGSGAVSAQARNSSEQSIFCSQGIGLGFGGEFLIGVQQVDSASQHADSASSLQ